MFLHICSQLYSRCTAFSLFKILSLLELLCLQLLRFWFFFYSITILKNFSSFLPAPRGNGNRSPCILTEAPEMCSSDTDISLCSEGPRLFSDGRITCFIINNSSKLLHETGKKTIQGFLDLPIYGPASKKAKIWGLLYCELPLCVCVYFVPIGIA